MSNTFSSFSWELVGRSLLWFLIFATFGLFVVFLYYLLPFAVQLPFYTVLGLIAGWLAADFVTGMIHWFGDTWGKPSWPILGKYFIEDFRIHHIHPQKICEHDFVYMCASSFFFAPYVIIGGIYVLVTGGALGVFLGTTIASMALWGALTNLFHKWAHDDAVRVAPLVRWLQQKRVILSPQHHQIHHTYPHLTHYAITHGWVNVFLGKIRFFRALEWVICKIFRTKPRQN
ncbi:hypothetical protein HYV86_03000 [Candidatus Woesearchaeota archaeon]|nr:hypothetical protein [Candidatus Woesearchaeota archaeon]